MPSKQPQNISSSTKQQKQIAVKQDTDSFIEQTKQIAAEAKKLCNRIDKISTSGDDATELVLRNYRREVRYLRKRNDSEFDLKELAYIEACNMLSNGELLRAAPEDPKSYLFLRRLEENKELLYDQLADIDDAAIGKQILEDYDRETKELFQRRHDKLVKMFAEQKREFDEYYTDDDDYNEVIARDEAYEYMYNVVFGIKPPWQEQLDKGVSEQAKRCAWLSLGLEGLSRAGTLATKGLNALTTPADLTKRAQEISALNQGQQPLANNQASDRQTATAISNSQTWSSSIKNVGHSLLQEAKKAVQPFPFAPILADSQTSNKSESFLPLPNTNTTAEDELCNKISEHLQIFAQLAENEHAKRYKLYDDIRDLLVSATQQQHYRAIALILSNYLKIGRWSTIQDAIDNLSIIAAKQGNLELVKQVLPFIEHNNSGLSVGIGDMFVAATINGQADVAKFMANVISIGPDANILMIRSYRIAAADIIAVTHAKNPKQYDPDSVLEAVLQLINNIKSEDEIAEGGVMMRDLAVAAVKQGRLDLLQKIEQTYQQQKLLPYNQDILYGKAPKYIGSVVMGYGGSFNICETLSVQHIRMLSAAFMSGDPNVIDHILQKTWAIAKVIDKRVYHPYGDVNAVNKLDKKFGGIFWALNARDFEDSCAYPYDTDSRIQRDRPVLKKEFVLVLPRMLKMVHDYANGLRSFKFNKDQQNLLLDSVRFAFRRYFHVYPSSEYYDLGVEKQFLLLPKELLDLVYKYDIYDTSKIAPAWSWHSAEEHDVRSYGVQETFFAAARSGDIDTMQDLVDKYPVPYSPDIFKAKIVEMIKNKGKSYPLATINYFKEHYGQDPKVQAAIDKVFPVNNSDQPVTRLVK